MSNINVKYCEQQFKIGFQVNVRQNYEKNECLKKQISGNVITIDISITSIQYSCSVLNIGIYRLNDEYSSRYLMTCNSGGSLSGQSEKKKPNDFSIVLNYGRNQATIFTCFSMA